MKQYILAAVIASVLVAATAVAQTNYSSGWVPSAPNTTNAPRMERDDEMKADLVRLVEEQQAQLDARTKEVTDLYTKVQRLQELVQSQKLQVEVLRLYVFCRTSMRPELCTEPQR